LIRDEPVADPIEAFVGLEVNVRHACADGVDQDLLQVADNRRIVDIRVGFVLGRFVAGIDVNFEVVVADHIRQLLTGRLGELADNVTELVVLDDDGVDDEIGLEADFVERLQIGRIGYCDEQAVAALG
jgi:hypothetical protein